MKFTPKFKNFFKGIASAFDIWPVHVAPKPLSDDEAHRENYQALRKDWEKVQKDILESKAEK